jgi:predicted AAA+ superfamily ATPase
VVPKIGELLKILFDTYKDIQFVATGSSSFELSQQVGEPLVGRSWEFLVLPLSLREITENDFELQQQITTYMLYGGYPEIYSLDPIDKKEKLISIAYQYASKDILAFDGIKKSDIIINLLKYLAFQIGNDCSYDGIANKLQVSSVTVKKYIDLLEKTFVIFRLKSYSRNLRSEISKKFKIYFYDIGIRNGIINQFNTMDSISRNDIGAVFENVCIVERMKKNALEQNKSLIYFWRLDRDGEVDYIEEKDGILYAFEFKYNQEGRSLDQVVLPKKFREAYVNNQFAVVDKMSMGLFV